MDLRSVTKRIHKSQKVVNFTHVYRRIAINLCRLSCVGWPNGEELASSCVRIWTRPVIASQRKWVAKRKASSKLASTCESVWPGLYVLLLLLLLLLSSVSCWGRYSPASFASPPFSSSPPPEPSLGVQTWRGATEQNVKTILLTNWLKVKQYIHLLWIESHSHPPPPPPFSSPPPPHTVRVP